MHAHTQASGAGAPIFPLALAGGSSASISSSVFSDGSLSATHSPAHRTAMIRAMWRDRIRGAQRNVDVWAALLAVRSLVLPMPEDAGTWLKFASLARKSGRTSQARATLLQMLSYDAVAARIIGDLIHPSSPDVSKGLADAASSSATAAGLGALDSSLQVNATSISTPTISSISSMSGSSIGTVASSHSFGLTSLQPPPPTLLPAIAASVRFSVPLSQRRSSSLSSVAHHTSGSCSRR